MALRGLDKHSEEILRRNPVAAAEYARLFADLPVTLQLGILRRKRLLSQRGLAKKMGVKQPHVARTESAGHDPRISSIVKAAKAIRCHLMLVPDENLKRLAAA